MHLQNVQRSNVQIQQLFICMINFTKTQLKYEPTGKLQPRIQLLKQSVTIGCAPATAPHASNASQRYSFNSELVLIGVTWALQGVPVSLSPPSPFWNDTTTLWSQQECCMWADTPTPKTPMHMPHDVVYEKGWRVRTDHEKHQMSFCSTALQHADSQGL